MIDINTPLQKAYYDAISATDIPVYEGEEPDNLTAPIYAVISDITSTDDSDLHNNAFTAQIQVSIHSWKLKYNNSADLNTATQQILQQIKPSVNSVLSLGNDLQMVTQRLTTDRTERFGRLGGREYVSRILVFNHKIVIHN